MNLSSIFSSIHIPEISFPFFGGAARAVGVDIGVYAIKVVELRRDAGRAALETYGELLAAPYLKEGGESGGGFLQYHDDEIIQLLTEVLRASGVKAKDAMFAIPSAASFVTTLEMPRMPKEELEKAVPFEARKYIPVPVKDVLLDWQILGGNESGEGITVLLVAVPKDAAARIQMVASRAGLRLRGMEIESFSIMRAVLKNEFTPTAIVHIGHASSVVIIADNGELRVSHNILRGSNEWTRALERGLGVSAERAEEIKKATGLSERVEDREITATVSSFVEAFFGEIDRIFSFYHRKSGRRVQKIEFSGAGSALRGLVEAAVMHFEIEAKRANPFAKVVAPPAITETLQEIGPAFAVAVGLALRQMASR